MDFYNFINKYELLCKKDYYQAIKDKQRYEAEIESINQEIRHMKGLFRKPAPLYLTSSLVGGSMFGMLFAIMFSSGLWILYLLLLIVFSILGIANEAYERNWKEELDLLYTALKEAHKDKHSKELVESKLKSLINDIDTCYQYYFYMVKDEDRQKPINITQEEVYTSQCRLSTFLHEFYNGDLVQFRSLYPHQQIREEQNLRISQKVREAKAEQLGFEEPIERPHRRSTKRYYNEYVAAGSNALKR